ncbi:stearoyl-CoA desaturase 5-like, partial [Cryptotermes secundus]|uniref:stearoyl-CoA desaturase 5-like n=1 Tax=Cryptotermes secundus TaxID=105785 RepID=UPI001454CB7F
MAYCHPIAVNNNNKLNTDSVEEYRGRAVGTQMEHSSVTTLVRTRQALRVLTRFHSFSPQFCEQKDIFLGNMVANGEADTATPAKQQMKWNNVILLTVIHLLALYSLLVVVPRAKLLTVLW